MRANLPEIQTTKRQSTRRATGGRGSFTSKDVAVRKIDVSMTGTDDLSTVNARLHKADEVTARDLRELGSGVVVISAKKYDRDVDGALQGISEIVGFITADQARSLRDQLVAMDLD